MENNNEDLSFRQDELPEDASLLIIDDDKAFLQRLGRAMEQRGFKVRMADTVSEATELIRQEPPAFAVVDMRLEDGNGLEVIAELSKLRPNARAIILTGLWQYRHRCNGCEAWSRRLSRQAGRCR